MIFFPTWIPGFDSHRLSDLFLSFDATICSTMAFPPLANSDHVVVSVSIDFPSNSQRNAQFHHMPYDYSRTDSNGLRDHLRHVSWEDIFKLGVSADASEFCEWVRIVIDVYIPHRKNHIKPHSSPWFSASCAAAIEITVFVYTNFIQTSNHCKRVLEAVKIAYAIKRKESITS